MLKLKGMWMLALVVLPFVAAANGLTPEQVAQMRMVTETVVSPQGGQVAYLLSVPRSLMSEDDGAAWTELHVSDARGNSRPYITGQVNVRQPAWTRDGQALTFLAKRAGDEHVALYLMPVAGGEARRVAKLETAISGYAVSHDGARVALLARAPESADNRALRLQGFSQKVHEEDWLDTGVWIAPMAGGDAERLPVEGTVHQVHWSPDGRRLALAVAPTPAVDDSLVFTRVRVVDAQSGEVLSRIDNPGKLGPIEWSPDGSHLAMIAGEDESDPREGRLVVVPAAGGQTVDVLPGLIGHVWRMGWSDANTLAFISMEGVEARIGTVRRDGRNARTVVRAGGPIFTQMSVARNGDIALTGSTPAHPNEAFLLPRGANAARRLTNSNPWLAGVPLGRQEVVRYAARDGLEIEGLLIRPLDAREGQRYPLILQIHGGPEAHYSNGWLTQYNLPGQVAAARGFAVFYPNYRASTGRGVEFSKLDHLDPAGKEFDDYVDGVDHLIEIGLVDGDKVGITGGSYGGYATAWGATYYSERFAAGVMAVGISDATMMMALGDIPYEMYRVHLRVWPWENWDLYRERSPLYHTANSRTPLLIMHGEADTRVHPGHSLALYRLLRLQDNAPVRLILYPGEGHGNQRAASRYDFSLRQLRWFEHYLQGPGGEPPAYALEYPALRDGDDDE
ncbi:MAG: S9 family peptidase [Xanthomonadaceae bacterium]|nr:S9 family peptidase [Xanthomonadaceae bacterium]